MVFFSLRGGVSWTEWSRCHLPPLNFFFLSPPPVLVTNALTPSFALPGPGPALRSRETRGPGGRSRSSLVSVHRPDKSKDDQVWHGLVMAEAAELT